MKFELNLTEDKLAEAEQAGLHKKFKLEAAINTTNMVSDLSKLTSDRESLICFLKLRPKGFSHYFGLSIKCYKRCPVIYK